MIEDDVSRRLRKWKFFQEAAKTFDFIFSVQLLEDIDYKMIEE